MPKKTAVLIGTGAIAREHLTVLADMHDVEVAAVCDLSAARAEATAERFGVKKWYTSHSRMLEDMSPNFVHITTPPESHYELARICLEMGLNVLCEKPITSSYDEFQSLKKLATDKGALLIENQNYRFHSSVQAIQKYVQSGKVGEIIEVQVQVFLDIHSPDSVFLDPNLAHYTSKLRGGVAGDFLTHISYLAQLFMGKITNTGSVWFKLANDHSAQNDEFRAILKGEHTSAFVSFSGNAQPNGFWLRVLGSKGQVEANLFEPPRLSFRRHRSGAPPVASLTDGIGEARDIFKGSFLGLWRKLAGTGRYDGLAESIRRSYSALDSGDLPVSLEQIDDTCRLIQLLTSDERRL